MNAMNYLKMDLKLIQRSIKTFFFFPLLAFIFIFTGNGIIGTQYVFFLMIAINIMPFSVEGNGNYARLYYSMPAKINDMVKGRYFFLILSAFIVWILAFLATYYSYTKGNLTPFQIFTCFLSGAAMTLTCLIQYPLYYKFGIAKSRILTMLIYLLPAFASFALPSILGKSSTGIIAIDISHITIYLIITVIVVISFFISYLISNKICANKEL